MPELAPGAVQGQEVARQPEQVARREEC